MTQARTAAQQPFAGSIRESTGLDSISRDGSWLETEQVPHPSGQRDRNDGPLSVSLPSDFSPSTCACLDAQQQWPALTQQADPHTSSARTQSAAGLASQPSASPPTSAQE